ncbi:MAG: sigma-70 family RNA polymerase sigma factor [Phycisphaerae bacterium]|nr:sigma-70 family RNA polymerase sigma factor [Phycisphaerae bacterium]MBN8598345.1 sigma-70 family RNA polymerase sigma factor [Planctomycetota bacterium]
MSASNRGDKEAEFEGLARLHAEMLSAYLRSLLGGVSGSRTSLLDDVFQEVLVVAWRRMDDFDRARPFDAWLRGIARNLVLEHARRHSVRLAVTDPAVLDLVDRRYESFAASLAPGSRFSDGVDRLLRCLAELPGAMREVMELAYGRGMMLKQVASALGIEEETVKKRVQRSRGALAECMKKQEGVS